MSDSLWEQIAPLLPKPKSRYRGRGRQRKHIGGRPAAKPRQLMSAILYILRTGCQWNALPKEFGISGKTAHRYFQRWVRAGVFKRMWQAGLQEFDELKGIVWKWQAADGAIDKGYSAATVITGWIRWSTGQVKPSSTGLSPLP